MALTVSTIFEIIASLALFALTMVSALVFVLHADKICHVANI